jgi:hypothetical protein
LTFRPRSLDGAGDAPPHLDLVDRLGLRLVDELERRPARSEDRDPSALRLRGVDLLQPERFAEQRQRPVEVLDGEDKPQLAGAQSSSSSSPSLHASICCSSAFFSASICSFSRSRSSSRSL